MKNELGIEDPAELRRREGYLAVRRQQQLERSVFRRTFDFRHLCFLHRWLFQDVYAWAGQTRNVPINKDGSEFAQPQFIQAEADRIFTKLRRDEHLRVVDAERLPHDLAELFGDINALHPFREGNGRVQRLFLTQLVGLRGSRLAWDKVRAQEMIAVSVANHRGDPGPSEKLFARILREG